MSSSFIQTFVILYVSAFVYATITPITFEENDSPTCKFKCETLCKSGQLDKFIPEHFKKEEKEDYPDNDSPTSCEQCSMENLEYVNRYRVQFRLNEIPWNKKLSEMAVEHSYQMFHRRSLYHSNNPAWENIAFS